MGLIALAFALAKLPLPWLAGTLAVVTLVISTLIHPALALLVLAIAIPFGSLLPLPVTATTGIDVNIVDLLVLLAAVAWVAKGMASRAIVLRRAPLLLPLLTLLWIAALSLSQAMSWRPGLPEWLKWAELAVVYFLAAQVLERRHIWWLLAALFTAGLLEVAIGAYQFVRQIGPEAFTLMGRFMRAFGTFRQPNPYAGYLGYLMPIALSLAVAAVSDWWASRRIRSLWLGLTGAVVSVALLAGIAMSWSRGAWLGAAAAVATVLLFSAIRSRRGPLLLATLATVLCLAIAAMGTGWLLTKMDPVIASLAPYPPGSDPAQTEITDQNFSALERLAHWQAGMKMFEDHPWLGVGIGNYALAYDKYAPPHWYDPLGHAHNVYINFLGETGVLGLAAFLLLWLAAIRATLQAGGARDRYLSGLGIGLLGTLIYLSVHNMFDHLFVQHMQLQLALLLGAITGMQVLPLGAEKHVATASLQGP